MTDMNETIIKMAPEVKLIIQTLVFDFCSVVGAWLLFAQWWMVIKINFYQAKGWAHENYSLAPGGGILFAIGIYNIPVPQIGSEWVGQFTSVIQPYWWIPLVIDPFHLMLVAAITIVAIPYLFRRCWNYLFRTAPSESTNKKDDE